MSAPGPPVAYPTDKRLRPPQPRVLAVTAKPKALTPFGQFVAAAVQSSDSTRLANWIAKLTAYSTRHTLSPENLEVGYWLRSQFRSLGYQQVDLHPFAYSGVTRYNVICTKPGTTDPTKYFIVCAHYDSRQTNLGNSAAPAPGADDNASGVAALLEIARVLGDLDTTYSVRFVAFSGEEQGLIGSQAYAASLSANSTPVPLLINLDMIGHPSSTTNPQIIIERDLGNLSSTNDGASQAFASQMVQLAADHTSIGTQLGPIYASDYMPFEAQGYVVVGLFDGADSAAFYHTANDTVDKVQESFCTEAARLTLATTLAVAGKKVGATLLFDPDPITASGNATLTLASPNLDSWRRAASMQGLAAPDASGTYHLTGALCRVVDAAAPQVNPATSGDGVFVYGRSQPGFADVMAYFHIDRTMRRLQSIGMPGALPSPLKVDAHSSGSFYDPAAKVAALAVATSGPAAAEDAGAIVHVTARAMQATLNPGFATTSGLATGFSDLVPAILHDPGPAAGSTHGMTAPWAGFGRRYDRTWKFNGPTLTTEPARGELWASTMFELYRKLGGDSSSSATRRFAADLALKLHLEATSLLPTSGATPTQAAQQLEAVDGNLGGWRSLVDGLHTKVIYDTFSQRNLAGYPAKATDVYIDDGRAGGYEWSDIFWGAQDVWVRRQPYTASQLASATAADHEQPQIGAPTYLYVKVGNRGVGPGGSGPLTVNAYHCQPGMGLVWPTSWTALSGSPAAAASLTAGSSKVVGPFQWTPSSSHECVLAAVDCASDRSITQTLPASAQVPHFQFVPFDNNVAQRNLSSLPTKEGTKVRFSVANPFPTIRDIEFEVHPAAGGAWNVSTDLPGGRTLQLGPHEQQWVELTVEPASDPSLAGSQLTPRVDVVAHIEGVNIGGLSFAAPERKPTGPVPQPVGGTTCLSTALSDADIEGSLDIHVKFQRRTR